MHRETKKETKLQNKKKVRPEVLNNDEIRNMHQKGGNKGVE